MTRFKKHTFIIIFLFVLVFTRFVNLRHSATFFWDQTEFLVKSHQIWVDKSLTLVGAISEDNTKVWSSLTNYLYMPFTLIGNFSPTSITYAAAFWGCITALAILLTVKKLKTRFVAIAAILLLIWFPLVETSRWAWNPHFIPLCVALGVLFSMKKGRLYQFLAGLFLGLTIHFHYLSIIAIGAFSVLYMIEKKQRNKFRQSIYFLFGLISAFLPFVIFDLLHPPGIFINRMVSFATKEGSSITALGYVNGVFESFTNTFTYYTHSVILSVLLVFLISLLFISDFRNQKKNLIFFIPWIAQILVVPFFIYPFNHYLLAGLPFFIFWLLIPRKSHENYAKIIIIILIVGSVYTIIPQLKDNPFSDISWHPNIQTVENIQDVIETEIRDKDLKNVNIAVIGSTDKNTYGLKYRNLLLIDEVRILSRYEYDITDNLFVVSQKNEQDLRDDKAYEIKAFKDGRIVNEWSYNNGWKLYLFNK